MSAGGTTTNTISKLHCYNFETQTDITASTQMDINIYIESLLLQAKDMNVTKSLSHSDTCFLVVLQPKGYTRTPTEAWWSLSLPFGRVKHEKIEVPQQDNQCFRNCLKMCKKYLMYTDCTALQCYIVTVLQCHSVTVWLLWLAPLNWCYRTVTASHSSSSAQYIKQSRHSSQTISSYRATSQSVLGSHLSVTH